MRPMIDPDDDGVNTRMTGTIRKGTNDMLLAPIAKTVVTGALLLGGCHMTKGTAIPDCPTDVVILNYDEALHCDLTPPQTLVLILVDASDSSMIYCDDAGGQVLIRPTEVLCLGVDY